MQVRASAEAGITKRASVAGLGCDSSKWRSAQRFPSLSRPVHGLIFLFKWHAGEEPSGAVVQDSRMEKIFFAKQVRGNGMWGQTT